MATDMEAEFLAIQEKLYSYLYRLTTNKQDAQDLVQDTFLRVVDNAENFEGKSSFKTWAYSIATNLARDKKRVRDRWSLDVQDRCKENAIAHLHHRESMIHAFQNQTIKQFEIVEHINYCFNCISKNLTLEKQIAIILKEVYAFKRNEIADILNVTENVVKHLLFDSRAELQKKYDHRCAMINKNGVCYQCAELNDYLQEKPDAVEKIKKTGLSQRKDSKTNLDIRFKLISKIDPTKSNGAALEEVIMDILKNAIEDK